MNIDGYIMIDDDNDRYIVYVYIYICSYLGNSRGIQQHVKEK